MSNSEYIPVELGIKKEFNEKEGYMCLTDYEWHLEGDELGAIVYPSVKALEACPFLCAR